MKNKTFINWMGLFGIVSFLSYLLAIIFSPIAYPGYDWMSQAVSDLSANNAPSLFLWNQLSAPYEICGIVSIMFVVFYVKDNASKSIRTGIYMFALMNWISAIGYKVFPLSASGYGGSFQDVMHMIITALVVFLTISSLVLIIIGSIKNKNKKLTTFTTIILVLLFIGAIGAGIVPKEYFGIPERISVLATTSYNLILGLFLFFGFEKNNKLQESKIKL